MTNQEKIQNVINDAQLILNTKYNGKVEGMSIVVTSYKVISRSKITKFGFHFEKENTIKVGDLIKRNNGIVQKIEYVIA